MLRIFKKNKTLSFVSFLFLIVAFFSSFAQDGWKEEKSKHFIVYYQDAPDAYIQELASRAESCYRQISGYLGYKGFDFWTWENRCKIYIHNNKKGYLSASGSDAWSRARVDVKKRRIDSYFGQDFFFDTILPHELGHIIFRVFVGFDKKLPLCLEEGIACNQEKDYSLRLDLAEVIVDKKMNLSFDNLLKAGKIELKNPVIFYSQCASMVDFLINRFGRRRFVSFCRLIRDQGNWPGSLLKVYRFNSLEDFEQRWLEFLKKGVIKER